MTDVENDFDNTCRTCLAYSTELQSIFEVCATTTLPVQLTSLIMSITKVEISLNDGMPDKICNLCKAAVHQAYLYKLKCEESDFILRKYFEKKCQNLDIKEEEHDFELHTDLVLVEDPLQDPIGKFDDDPLQDPIDDDVTIAHNNLPTRRSTEISSQQMSTKTNLGAISDKANDNYLDKDQEKQFEIVDDRYLCGKCGKSYVGKQTFEVHLSLHMASDSLKTKNYPCDYCDDVFDNNKSRSLHWIGHIKNGDVKRDAPAKQLKSKQLKSEHKPNKRKRIYPVYDSGPNGMKQCECKLCDKAFSKIAALSTHMVQHANDIHSLAEIDFTKKLELFDGLNLDVDPRNQTNDSLIRLVQHQIIVGANQRFYQILNTNFCEMNLSDSETESESEMHVDSNTTLAQCYQCSRCDRNFDRSWKIFNHMKDHPNDEFEHKCSYCNRMYPNSVLLDKHLRGQCENTSKTFRCHLCGIKFMWRSSRDSHIEKIHLMKIKDEIKEKKTRTFGCDKCERKFYSSEQLERHKKMSHSTPAPTEKKYSCDVCNNQYTRKNSLRYHLRKPHETKLDKVPKYDDNYLCDYCGRSFWDYSTLYYHKRRHTGEKPYKCDLCGKCFCTSSSLKCHRLTHTGEKPHICTICGKGFARSDMSRHMRVHTGIRPFNCTYCDRSFTQSHDLTLHIRRHTGERPYACGVCGDRFIQRAALEAHRHLQAHFEDSQPTPFANLSAKNPNRYTNAYRVNRIGTSEKPALSNGTVDAGASINIGNATNASTTLASQVNRSTSSSTDSKSQTACTFRKVKRTLQLAELESQEKDVNKHKMSRRSTRNRVKT